MLLARSEELDRVRGLETGADDYVIKPYSIAGVDGPRPRQSAPGAANDGRSHPAVSGCSTTVKPTASPVRALQ